MQKLSIVLWLTSCFSLACINSGGGADGASSADDDDGGGGSWAGGTESTVVTGTNLALAAVECTPSRTSAESSQLSCAIGLRSEGSALQGAFTPASGLEGVTVSWPESVRRLYGDFAAGASCQASADSLSYVCSFNESNVATFVTLEVELASESDALAVSDTKQFKNECLGLQSSTSYSAFGSGTEKDPYLLCFVEQIEDISVQSNQHNDLSALAAHYRLGLDLTSINNIAPIGNASNPFTGSFQGNGYKLANFNLTAPNFGSSLGLFGVTDGARLDYFTIDSATLSFDLEGGTLVGTAKNNSRLTRIEILSTDIDNNSVNFVFGGMVGRLMSGSIIEDSRALDLSLTDIYIAGGLVGENYGTVRRSYASIIDHSASSPAYLIGGLIGTNQSTGTVENSYVTGKISNASSAGGFIGENRSTNVINSYAAVAMNVSGGDAFIASSIMGGTSSGCFYDQDVAGTYFPVTSTSNAASKSSAEMQTLTTFTAAGWDFNNIWSYATGSYPYLTPFE